MKLHSARSHRPNTGSSVTFEFDAPETLSVELETFPSDQLYKSSSLIISASISSHLDCRGSQTQLTPTYFPWRRLDKRGVKGT